MTEAVLPDEGFVLLVNARAQKGFDLFLQVAARCPDIPFVAIASQSPRSNALQEVQNADVGNVTILDMTEDMAALYERARVVLVPSYRFVETFSRTCIEAHRYGLPVLGSTVGNVPNLLAQSGIVLPEDPEAWANEITRLFEDEAYYTERQELARENSLRYSAENQRRTVGRILGFVRRRFLIGVGSGIGNMLHVGPMIRNIAQRCGHTVDIVVSEDHANSLFLLHNPDYVNAVFALRPAILEKSYETVFLTHSFGGARVAFAGDQVIWSRDWQQFRPGYSAHETIFNLEAAQALLGIPYNPDSIPPHFISDFEYKWADGLLIGIHGGSKDSYWTSKRWDGFPRLAAALAGKGFRLASFGTPDEYIPGTEDRTGGTIEAMARSMQDCSYFVSNDSGGMNIAQALGIPVIGIFGPTDVGTRKPLSALSVTVQVAKECAPCEVKDPARFKAGTCSCIQEIGVDEVLNAFEALRARMRREEGLEPAPMNMAGR